MPEEQFDAKQFVRDLDAGGYDATIHEEIKKLSPEQLKQIAETLILMRQKLRDASQGD